MDIKIELTGTQPLLCHNSTLADPDNDIVRQIAEYTGKRKKTEDDRRAIERLEWFGGLYIHDGRPMIPTGNIRRAFIESGKVSKQGLQVSRALSFTDLMVPIAYDGPADLEKLYANAAYRHRASVGIGTKRTMRMRPCFPTWAVVAEAFLLEDVMDVKDLQLVARRAGQAIGLGDNRINGYGRFAAVVVP